MADGNRNSRKQEEERGCVFRYRLRDLPADEPQYADRLAEMLRRQLSNILDIAVPQRRGVDAEIDSFRFLPESKSHELFPGKSCASSRPTGAGIDHASPPSASRPGGSEAARSAKNMAVGRSGIADFHLETAFRGEHGADFGGDGARGKRGALDGDRAGTDLGGDVPSPLAEKEGGASRRYRSLTNASLYEPRIEFIARQLASLLEVVELECEGRPVKVDGFRLRDPDDWTGPYAATPADVFQHAATRCQYDCVFCYNRGAPPTLRRDPRGLSAEWRELSARLERYNPRAGTGLFPSFGSPREVLAHPHALRLLAGLRERTDAPFRLSTNGGTLDAERVAALAALAPVFLDVSLHSSSPRRRAMLMGDPDPRAAVEALPRLAEAGVPFAVTVVAWPLPTLEEALDDLAETARYAAACGASMVQVNLPGFSRFFSRTPPFDTDAVWPEIVRTAAELRREAACPVFVSPAMYEENLTREVKNRAEVIGVVPNSPAARAGLAAGDVVVEVNGVRVSCRPRARDLLSLAQKNGAGAFALRVMRGGREMVLGGDTSDHDYPYDPCTSAHLGAVFMGSGFRASHLDEVQAAIHARGARRPLLLTSALVRPTLEQLLRERPLALPEGCSLALGVPENSYFGGNIILGDLLVVEDFVRHIRECAAGNGHAPDLVLIPSSPFHLSGWGRDLTGRPYLDIERRTGIPVELLRCETIWE